MQATLPVDRRDWLRQNGWTVGNRGRFSSDMWDAMDKAEQNGTAFLDKKSGLSIGTGRSVDENGNSVITKVEVNPWAHHPDPIRTAEYYWFRGADNRIKVSVKEACTSCLYSLGWCYCSVPTFRNWRTGEVMIFDGACN